MEAYNEVFLRHAIQASIENVQRDLGGPFGAVIVRNGEVIAEAANAVTRSNDPTAHAEVGAIRAACEKLQTFELSGCVLYSSCEPCPMCLAAAYWARLDGIYFAATQQDAASVGFDDAFLYRELTLNSSERALSCVFVEAVRENARVAFEKWDENTAKTSY